MSILFSKEIIAVTWINEPNVAYVVGATVDKLQLVDDMIYTIHYKGGTSKQLIIPKSFRFEGSVPSITWSLTRVTSSSPEALPGWCLHDMLYCLVKVNLVDRAEADLCLKFCLKNRFNFLQVSVVYYSVRVFGGIYANRTPTDADLIDINLFKSCNLAD